MGSTEQGFFVNSLSQHPSSVNQCGGLSWLPPRFRTARRAEARRQAEGG
jgi:hypothetical protein